MPGPNQASLHGLRAGTVEKLEILHIFSASGVKASHSGHQSPWSKMNILP